MSTLYQIHSDLRWLLVVIAIVTMSRLTLGLIRRETTYAPSSRALMLAFTISVDVQVLIGMVYFLWNGLENDYFPRQRFEHLAVMLVSLAIAHFPVRWRKKTAPIRYRNDLRTVLVVLALIFAGVMLLPGGLDRWQF